MGVRAVDVCKNQDAGWSGVLLRPGVDGQDQDAGSEKLMAIPVSLLDRANRFLLAGRRME